MSAKHQGAQFKHKFSSLGPRWTVECHSRLLLENHPWSELPESMGSPVKALPFLPPLGQWCRTASPLSTAYMGSYDSCFFCLFGFSFPFLLSLQDWRWLSHFSILHELLIIETLFNNHSFIKSKLKMLVQNGSLTLTKKK